MLRVFTQNRLVMRMNEGLNWKVGSYQKYEDLYSNDS
jgi:hypothetical protein